MKIILEKEAEDFLEKNQFSVVNRNFIKNKSQLKNIKLSFPWVMKVYSRKIIHKNKANGIILNIKNLSQAKHAFIKLSKLKGFQGTIIQEQIKGQELILGLKSTEDFGLSILLGKGGTDVEKIKDITFRIIPINQKDAEQMIKDLKIKINNKQAIINNLLKLNKLALKNKNIQELDINPIILTKDKATIVDARIIK
jgi:succinyl-CoA synthetase beta subunit